MLTELVHKRRSVRNYLPDPPPLPWLKEVVDCGRAAPSPSNSQPVRVRHVASDMARRQLQTALAHGRTGLLGALSAAGGPKRIRNYIRVYYRYSEFMFTAPWLLLVGTTRTTPGFSDHLAQAGLVRSAGKTDRDTDISVGLFVSAMLLKATQLGLGSCVLTAPLVFLESENHLDAFNNIVPKCFVTLGYSATTPPRTQRRPLTTIMETI